MELINVFKVQKSFYISSKEKLSLYTISNILGTLLADNKLKNNQSVGFEKHSPESY